MNAAITVIGSFIYSVLAKWMRTYQIIRITFCLIALAGVGVLIMGHQSPVLFALVVMPAAIGGGIHRPPCTNLLLEQGNDDAGSASSLMCFTLFAIGSAGMMLISLEWQDRINIFGLTTFVAGLLPFLFWPMVWRKGRPINGNL